MKLSRLSTPVASAVLALASSVPCLYSQGAQGGADKPAAEQQKKTKPAPSDAALAESIRSAIERLGSTDFDTRRSAADELVARGRAALPFLEKAIRKSEDAELRWQARRVARRIESGASKRVRELEAQERKSAPKLGRVRKGDATPRRRQGRALDLDIDDIPGLDPRFAERLRERMNDFFQGQGGARFRFGPNFGKSESSSLSVRIDEDGVRVEESTREDGKEKKKVYEAPDMKTLLEKYPELKGRVGQAPRLRIDRDPARFFEDFPGFGRGFGAPGFGRDIRRELEDMQEKMRAMQERLRSQLGGRGFDRDFDRDEERRDARSEARVEKRVEEDERDERDERVVRRAPQGPTLGIYVHEEIPAALRSYLELKDGVGLWVQNVVDGSIAAKSGVKVGDIVTKIGERTISSAADVRAALAQKGALEIHVVRKGALERLRVQR